MGGDVVVWDPDRYLIHAEQRARPFEDLVARIGSVAPKEVVDLGCGPGNLTVSMTQRWPSAHVTGVDSSREMIDAAAGRAGVDWVHADLRTWRPVRPVDVLVSNATLQWVPDHLAVLPRLAGMVTPGGWLAFQVPGNFGEPSHVLLSELVNSPRWKPSVGGLARPASREPVEYLDALVSAGLVGVDVWETTYYHVLTGENPVLEWVSGTALRPVLAALDDTERAEFLAEYGAAVHHAYPPRADGTVILPYRRIFAVGARPADPLDG